jgi:hypothetical protein
MTEGKRERSKVVLDWSKLLGFDQVRVENRGEITLTDCRLSKIGGKRCEVMRPLV